MRVLTVRKQFENVLLTHAGVHATERKEQRKSLQLFLEYRENSNLSKSQNRPTAIIFWRIFESLKSVYFGKRRYFSWEYKKN